MDFEIFRKSYKPHIRPDNLVSELAEAYRLDQKFAAEFRHVKPYLPTRNSTWADSVVQTLSDRGALPENFTDEDLTKIQSLYRQHSSNFRAGAFEETYLDSVEDVALFFIFHDVKTLWVSSAYADLTRDLLGMLFDRARLNRRVPVRNLARSLTCALSLELNQIQRTFTMYERYVSDALVKDLSFGGMLTSTPTGRPTAPPPLT